MSEPKPDRGPIRRNPSVHWVIEGDEEINVAKCGPQQQSDLENNGETKHNERTEDKNEPPSSQVS